MSNDIQLSGTQAAVDETQQLVSQKLEEFLASALAGRYVENVLPGMGTSLGNIAKLEDEQAAKALEESMEAMKQNIFKSRETMIGTFAGVMNRIENDPTMNLSPGMVEMLNNDFNKLIGANETEFQQNIAEDLKNMDLAKLARTGASLEGAQQSSDMSKRPTSSLLEDIISSTSVGSAEIAPLSRSGGNSI